MSAAAASRTNASSMMAWAISVVQAFQTAGQAIPNSAIALLPLVDVVLWYQRQTEPVELTALRARFKVSRATGYRWLWVLRRMNEEAAVASALKLCSAHSETRVRRALEHGSCAGGAR